MNSQPILVEIKPVYTFIEFGALMGIYFMSQAYGYATGMRSSKEFTVKESAIFGAKHLMHFFTPNGNVAWPLNPTICGFVYAILLYVPQISGPIPKLSYGIALATVFIGVLAIWFEPSPGTWWMRLYYRMKQRWGLFPVVYSLFFCVMTFASLNLIDAARFYLGDALCDKGVNELLIRLLTGGVLFSAFFGSRFDGILDGLDHS